jgi:hypothetical protein
VLTQRIDNRENKNFEGFDWNAFREWIFKRYSKTWAPTVFSYAKKYYCMLTGNLRELDFLARAKRTMF